MTKKFRAPTRTLSSRFCLEDWFTSSIARLETFLRLFDAKQFWVAWEPKIKVSKDRTLEICHIFYRPPRLRGRRRGVTGKKRRMGDNKKTANSGSSAVCARQSQKSATPLHQREKERYGQQIPSRFPQWLIVSSFVCRMSLYRRWKLYKFKGKKEKVKIEYHSVIVAGIFCPTSNVQRNLLAEEIRLQPKILHTK